MQRNSWATYKHASRVGAARFAVKWHAELQQYTWHWLKKDMSDSQLPLWACSARLTEDLIDGDRFNAMRGSAVSKLVAGRLSIVQFESLNRMDESATHVLIKWLRHNYTSGDPTKGLKQKCSACPSVCDWTRRWKPASKAAVTQCSNSSRRIVQHHP